MENHTPRPLNEFDMKEIYRLIRNDRIPGFNLLAREREYLDEYREALRLAMEQETKKVAVTKKAKKITKTTKSIKATKNKRKAKEEPQVNSES